MLDQGRDTLFPWTGLPIQQEVRTRWDSRVWFAYRDWRREELFLSYTRRLGARLVPRWVRVLVRWAKG